MILLKSVEVSSYKLRKFSSVRALLINLYSEVVRTPSIVPIEYHVRSCTFQMENTKSWHKAIHSLAFSSAVPGTSHSWSEFHSTRWYHQPAQNKARTLELNLQLKTQNTEHTGFYRSLLLWLHLPREKVIGNWYEAALQCIHVPWHTLIVQCEFSNF